MKINEIVEKYLNEDAGLGNMIAKTLEKKIKSIFPNSNVICKYDENIINGITIWFTFGKDKSEYANGISQNDIGYSTYHIYGKGRNDFGQPTFNVTSKNYIIFHTKEIDSDNPMARHMAIKGKRVKTNWRDFSTTNVEDVYRKFETYFSRVKLMLKDEKLDIPDNIRNK